MVWEETYGCCHLKKLRTPSLWVVLMPHYRCRSNRVSTVLLDRRTLVHLSSSLYKDLDSFLLLTHLYQSHLCYSVLYHDRYSWCVRYRVHFIDRVLLQTNQLYVDTVGRGALWQMCWYQRPNLCIGRTQHRIRCHHLPIPNPAIVTTTDELEEKAWYQSHVHSRLVVSFTSDFPSTHILTPTTALLYVVSFA